MQAPAERAARPVRVVALPGAGVARLGVSEGAAQALPEVIDGVGRCYLGHFFVCVLWQALGERSFVFLRAMYQYLNGVCNKCT